MLVWLVRLCIFRVIVINTHVLQGCAIEIVCFTLCVARCGHGGWLVELAG